MSNTDDVGRGKPKATRFPNGKNGNPSGRRKAAREMPLDSYNRVMRQKHSVSFYGKTETLDREEAILLKMIEKALKGDIAAAMYIDDVRDQVYKLRNAPTERTVGYLVVPGPPRNKEEEEEFYRELERQQAPFRGNQGELPTEGS